MKISKFVSLAVLVAIVIINIAGCSRNKKFGEEITTIETTKIKDILANSGQYDSQTVKVEGKIIQECPAGGWFYLQEGTSIIYINLHPTGFAIPQSVGKHAVAEGKLRSKEGGLEIVGKGVEIK